MKRWKSLDQDPESICPACSGNGGHPEKCAACCGTGWRPDLVERQRQLSRPAVSISFRGGAVIPAGEAGIEALKAELKASFDRLHEQLPGAEIHAHVTEVRVCRFCGVNQPEALDSDGSPLCCGEAKEAWWDDWVRGL